MAAAWWVVLPINFNSLYEVHLFAVIPVLIAFLVVAAKPGPWGRGMGIAMLLICALLMRNELLLAAILFAALCLGWEAWRVRRHEIAARGLANPYGIPIAAALAMVLLCYFRATDAGVIRPALERKHTLNVCQAFAFGYQQRHSDWTGSPWTDCQQLMTRLYGIPEPTLVQALRRNPAAMLEQFWWNVQLTPDGLEVLMVNGMSGSVDPDYAPVQRYSWALPLCLSIAITALVGFYVLYRDRQYWWKAYLRERIWVWIAMACVACVVPAVVVTQRPRPSYLLAFGIILRAAVGMGVFAIAHRFRWAKSIDILAPVVALLLLLFAPAYYTEANSPRPLLALYRTLVPYHDWIEAPNAGLVTPGFPDELCSYIGHSRSCRAFNFADIRRQVTAASPMNQVLDNNRASVFFADTSVLADPVARQFVSDASSYGWHAIAMRHDKHEEWELLVKPRNAASVLPGEPPPLDENQREIFDPASGIRLGSGWYEFEVFQGAFFRWVNNDAEIDVSPRNAGPLVLHLVVEPGPSLNGKPLELQLFSGGHPMESTKVVGRQIVDVKMPTGRSDLRIHTTSENKKTPNDARILNFRVFRIWKD
jgi:hypothetical protein